MMSKKRIAILLRTSAIRCRVLTEADTTTKEELEITLALKLPQSSPSQSSTFTMGIVRTTLRRVRLEEKAYEDIDETNSKICFKGSFEQSQSIIIVFTREYAEKLS